MQKFALKKFLIILIKMFFICSFAKMSDKEPERINKKESPIETEDTIKLNTNENLKDSFNTEKEKIKRQLKATKNVEERVKLFSKRTDTYWLEAIAWFIPAIWDLTPAIVSTCYLIAEWVHVWLSWKDCLKILWFQSIDILVWAIPVVWDIADFFFKWNKYSAKIFSEHFEKLKKAAIKKWISQSEIDSMWKKEARFIKTMDKYANYKSKKKKSKESTDLTKA